MRDTAQGVLRKVMVAKLRRSQMMAQDVRNGSLVLMATILSLSVYPARAGSLINGDFSQGLTGWTVSDPALVSVVNGQAVINESATALEVDLSQTFTVPSGALSLSFTLVTVVTEDDGNPPNAFGASLLNPNTLLPVVPTVDASTDSFYTRDLVTGVTQGQAASGVTVSPTPDALPLLITVNLPSALIGQDVTILFRLLSGGTDAGSSVTLDNVLVAANGAVPEPTGVLLFGLGSSFLVVWFSRRPCAERASAA
jgi:hypothetical protein